MDLLSLGVVDKLSAVVILTAIALSVITDKLIWHTRLDDAEKRFAAEIERIEKRADRWEQVALDALQAGAQAGVKAAETAVDVVSAIPDPANRQGG